MHIVKKIIRGLALASLSLWLLLLAGSVTFNMTFGRVNTVKSWFADSGIYDRALDVFTAQLAKNPEAKQGEGLDFNDPVIQAASQKALSPEFLKQLSDNFLTGVYNWLEGKVSKPDFRLDLTPAKDTFTVELAAQIKTKLAGLPACTRANAPPPDADLLSLQCSPPGLDVDAEVNKQAEGLFSGEGEGEPLDLVITADDLTKKDNGENAFGKSEQPIPKLFQLLHKAPFVLATLGVLSLALIIWLNEDKNKAIRRVAHAFLSAGLILLVGAMVARILLGNIGNQPISTDSQDVFNALGRPILRTANADLTRVQLWFGGIYTTLAVVIYILSKRFFKPPVKEAKETEKIPEKPKEKE